MLIYLFLTFLLIQFCLQNKKLDKIQSEHNPYLFISKALPDEVMGTHTSILAWEIPWTEEPGGLQSVRSQESDTT